MLRTLRHAALTTTCVLATGTLSLAAAAESVVPAEAAWTVRMNVADAFDSPIGDILLDRARRQFTSFDDTMDNLEQTLGFDPRESIGSAVLYGDRPGRGEVALVADLVGGRGKLEGWMLAMPGYQSEDLDDQTLLHSFLLGEGGPEGRPRGRADRDGNRAERAEGRGAERPRRDRPGRGPERVFITLPGTADGGTRLVASLMRDQALEATQALASGEADLDADALPAGRLLAAKLNRIPDRAMRPQDPGSAVLQSLEEAELTLGSAENISMELDLGATTPARARQLAQLLTGLQGLAGLLAMEQPELQTLVTTLQGIDVRSNDGSRDVSARLDLSTAQFEQALDTLLDLAPQE